MHQQAYLPEGNFPHLFPTRMQDCVAPTLKCLFQLQKYKVLQKCFHDRAHKVRRKGIIVCNRLLTVTNGQEISLTQCIMSMKSQHNCRFPIFLGVDVQENTHVIVTCKKSMSEETEAFFLSQLGLYFEQIFELLYGKYLAKSIRMT